MMLDGYLEEVFSQTAYAINVYIKPGANAIRLTRLSRDDIENVRGPRLLCTFRVKSRASNRRVSTAKVKRRQLAGSDEDESDASENNRPMDRFVAPKKRKMESEKTKVQCDASEGDSDDIEMGDDWEVAYSLPSTAKKKIARTSESGSTFMPSDFNDVIDISISSD